MKSKRPRVEFVDSIAQRVQVRLEQNNYSLIMAPVIMPPMAHHYVAAYGNNLLPMEIFCHHPIELFDYEPLEGTEG